MNPDNPQLNRKMEVRFDISDHPKVLDIQEFVNRLTFPCTSCCKPINFKTDKFLVARKVGILSGGVYHAKCIIEQLVHKVKYNREHPRKLETYTYKDKHGMDLIHTYYVGIHPKRAARIEQYLQEILKLIGNEPDLIPELL